MGEGPASEKVSALAMNEHLRDMVARRLQEDCSPQQISGWLKRECPDEEAMHISHETIYRTPCSSRAEAL